MFSNLLVTRLEPLESSMKAFVSLLCCVALTSVAAQQVQVYEWRRIVHTYDKHLISVAEATVVDSSAQTMVMKSEDPDLRATPFYRSQSFHDFNTGELALKPVGSNTCYVGTVRTTFQKTHRELKRRSIFGYPVSSRRRMTVVDPTQRQSSGNQLIDNFCSGMTFIKVQDVQGIPAVDFPPRFPPLYCIYGPIDIEFPDNQVPLITDFMGGFGFFP